MDQNLKNIYTPNDNSFLYYHTDYLRIQGHEHLKIIQQDNSLICFAIENAIAQSLPGSPFGGLFSPSLTQKSFLNFFSRMEKTLKETGVKKITLTQPPFYYSGFGENGWLAQAGYAQEIVEINQYIPMDGRLIDKLHSMQRRKLKPKKPLTFESAGLKDIPEIHRFIAACRQLQGLIINITVERLMALFETFPDRYQAYVVRLEGKIISALIVSIPVQDIVYYFLPATHPDFKKLSPMVPLMTHVFDLYAGNGFSYMDLGISSIRGNPQEGLMKFKERMGALNTSRITWSRLL